MFQPICGVRARPLFTASTTSKGRRASKNGNMIRRRPRVLFGGVCLSSRWVPDNRDSIHRGQGVLSTPRRQREVKIELKIAVEVAHLPLSNVAVRHHVDSQATFSAALREILLRVEGVIAEDPGRWRDVRPWL